jgi:hypothetical protein
MALTEYHFFCADAMDVAEKRFSASVDDELFRRKLFAEYENDGSPKNRKKWLAERLNGRFLFMDVPPRWVGEPKWAYHDNEPMIFLHQFEVEDPDNNMLGRFNLGDTIFIFGSKSPPNPEPDQTWRSVYRMVAQTEEGEHLHLYGWD